MSALGKRTRVKQNPKHSNKNIIEVAPIYTEAKEAAHAIISNEHDVVILDLGVRLNLTGIFDSFNQRVKPQARIKSFNITEKCKVTFPGKNAGMLNNYASPQSNQLIDLPEVQNLFTLTTGTPNWQLKPNRMRYNTYDDDKGENTIHIEGMNVLQDTTEISFIVCATAGRTFTYYKGSRNNEHARELYRAGGGCTSKFVKLSPEQVVGYQRTTVETTAPGQIILFADDIIHEISRRNRSLSIFLSPFDPQKEPSNPYEDMTRAQAIKYRKQHTNAPPFPPQLCSAGQKAQWPKLYQELTSEQCNIAASLFRIHSHVWPSGKYTFEYHGMASNTWKKVYLPFFYPNGKFQFEILTHDLVKNCPDFDHTYWDTLPLLNASEAEIQAMKLKFTNIPEPIWRYVKYWVTDPRTLSDNICRRRGYI